MPAKVDKEACVGCGTCVDACPEAAIEMDDEFAKVDEARCNECATCVDACPTQAIKIEKN
ncbi:4Fe-4S binding protein [Methanocella arvoryzae]|uniref:4Fe-4S binding protein n=1 Tax=Methanocella arvoryzae TaxID=1175445 RepID=UPI0003212D0C|nr:4Fe-4S binding protein [Methanocella arvoryzae]